MPKDVRLVAVVDGTPAVPTEPPWTSDDRKGAACGVALEQLRAQAVDQEDDVRRSVGQHQPRRRGTGDRGVDAQGAGDRRHDVAQRAFAVGRQR